MFFDGPVKHTLTQRDSKSESEKTWILRCACWLCNRPKEKIYRRRPSKKQIENFVNQNCEECDKMGEEMWNQWVKDDPDSAKEHFLEFLGTEEEWEKEKARILSL